MRDAVRRRQTVARPVFAVGTPSLASDSLAGPTRDAIDGGIRPSEFNRLL
jgi:hypothetical protein